MTYEEFVMRTVIVTIGAYVELYRKNRVLARQRCIEDARILADEMFGVKTTATVTATVDLTPRRTSLLKR